MSNNEELPEIDISTPDQVRRLIDVIVDGEGLSLEGVSNIGPELQKRFTDCIIIGDPEDPRSCRVFSTDDFATRSDYYKQPRFLECDSRGLTPKYSVNADLYDARPGEMEAGDIVGVITVVRSISNDVLPCDVESWLEYQILHTYNGGAVLKLDEPLASNTVVANARGRAIEDERLRKRLTDVQLTDVEAFANGEIPPSEILRGYIEELAARTPVGDSEEFVDPLLRGIFGTLSDEEIRAQAEEARMWAHENLLEVSESNVLATFREAEELLILLRSMQ